MKRITSAFVGLFSDTKYLELVGLIFSLVAIIGTSLVLHNSIKIQELQSIANYYESGMGVYVATDRLLRLVRDNPGMRYDPGLPIEGYFNYLKLHDVHLPAEDTLKKATEAQSVEKYFELATKDPSESQFTWVRDIRDELNLLLDETGKITYCSILAQVISLLALERRRDLRNV